MSSPGPKTLASAAMVVSVATGIVTNLITSEWSWSLAAALIILVVLAVAIAVWNTSSGAPSRTRVSQKAKRGGRINASGVTARNGGRVQQRATGQGEIENSRVTSRDSDVEQKAARKGKITNSPLDGE
ncbi:hypothetical protein ACFWSF_37770 [Streptomyces sp. NPDC058611]|uniref:hypothetical protein n=1 Tax=unclassified Streptomyces TaxID=2593676 RepID=UPI0036609D82